MGIVDSMDISCKDLKSCIAQSGIFIADIDRIWIEKNGVPGIGETLKQKMDMVGEGKIEGIMMFNGKLPLGIAWVEKVGHHYGNMVLHTIGDIEKEALIDGLWQSGALKEVLAELIHFSPTDDYREILLRKGFFENPRQRMALDLRQTQVPELAEVDPIIGFEDITVDKVPISSPISMEAHKISKDQEHAPDLRSLDKRMELERMVFSGKYGPVVQPASQFITLRGEPVGLCMVVEIPCWGIERVPWVFDVAVHPDYHGHGYGRLVFHKSMVELAKLGYEMIGLAVTLTNESAIHLYESLGFFAVEPFTEFIKDDAIQ